MASQVDIANRALIKLGSNTISNLNEQDPGAKIIAANWETIRRDELSKNIWYFAKKTRQIAAVAAKPIKWQYEYRRQTGDLRVVEIDNRYWVPYWLDKYYELQGHSILTDLPSPLTVTYICDVTNTGNYHAAFVEALAARHALEACTAITDSNTLLQSMYQWYDDAIREARRVDAIQSPPERIGGQESWVNSRRSGVIGTDHSLWS